MKKVLFAAISALLLTGAVRADDIIFTDTMSGTIASAYGYTAPVGGGNSLGSFDGTGEFGAGSLVGQFFTLSYTIDLTKLLNDATETDTDGSTYIYITDASNDGAIFNSLTIGGYDYSLGGYYQYLGIYTNYYGMNSILEFTYNVDASSDSATSPTIQPAPYNFDTANPLSSIDPTQLPALTNELFSDPNTFGYIYVQGPNGGNDYLYYNYTASSAPEPSTWLSLATGLGGLALLKLRRTRTGNQQERA
jgi:hypothetical protein